TYGTRNAGEPMVRRGRRARPAHDGVTASGAAPGGAGSLVDPRPVGVPVERVGGGDLLCSCGTPEVRMELLEALRSRWHGLRTQRQRELGAETLMQLSQAVGKQ